MASELLGFSELVDRWYLAVGKGRPLETTRGGLAEIHARSGKGRRLCMTETRLHMHG